MVFKGIIQHLFLFFAFISVVSASAEDNSDRSSSIRLDLSGGQDTYSESRLTGTIGFGKIFALGISFDTKKTANDVATKEGDLTPSFQIDPGNYLEIRLTTESKSNNFIEREGRLTYNHDFGPDIAYSRRLEGGIALDTLTYDDQTDLVVTRQSGLILTLDWQATETFKTGFSLSGYSFQNKGARALSQNSGSIGPTYTTSNPASSGQFVKNSTTIYGELEFIEEHSVRLDLTSTKYEEPPGATITPPSAFVPQLTYTYFINDHWEVSGNYSLTFYSDGHQFAMDGISGQYTF